MAQNWVSQPKRRVVTANTGETLRNIAKRLDLLSKRLRANGYEDDANGLGTASKTVHDIAERVTSRFEGQEQT